MLAFNVGQKEVSATWSEGYKIVSNVGFSYALIVSYNKKATIDTISGKHRALNINFGIKALSGSVTYGPDGSVTYGGCVSAGGYLSPISIDYEWGTTKRLKLWKRSEISKKLKEYYLKGIRITTKRQTNYSRFRIEKGRVQLNVYDSGKVKIKKY